MFNTADTDQYVRDADASYEFGERCGRLMTKWLRDIADEFGDYVESDVPYLEEVASEIGWETLRVEEFNRQAFEAGVDSNCLASKHLRARKAKREQAA
jgi:hypothetical protein